MRRAIVLLLLALAASAWSGRVARASTAARPDVRTLFDEANQRFREATRALRTEPDAARALLDESIARFSAIVDSGVENGRLYYNIGNAYMLRGDVGRAIANYLRADRLIPGDANLQANLAAARARTRDRIPDASSRRALETVLFWHYDIPERARWWIFVAVFDLVWLLALARLVWGSIAPRWLIVACAVVATAFAASLVYGRFEARRTIDGVVVADQVVGRKGPDATGYEPSFTAPLHAGAEFRVREQRGSWILARLADGRETWLPRGSVEVVNGRP